MNTLNTEKLDPDPGQAETTPLTADWPDGRNMLRDYHRARTDIF